MDVLARYFSSLTASTSCLGNMIHRRLEEIKERLGELVEKQTILIHDATHHNWHPWEEVKRLQIQKNVHKESVPKPTWEPGIEAGYRPPYKPWSYYFCSLFQFHNETVNVWTHLIGSLVIVLYMWHYHHIMDYRNNERAWPHLMLGICSLIGTSSSGAAHLIHSKSAFTHYVALSFDYAGAGIYSYGMSCCILFYSSYDNLVNIIGPYFLAINALFCANMCFCCCYGKIKYSLHHHLRRKLWFVISSAPPFLSEFLIWMPRIIKGYFLNPNPDPLIMQSWYLHLNHLVTFFVALFFFVSHVPEVFFEGEFDAIFHGHQIWHVLVVCTIVFQLYASHFDYSTRTRGPETMANLPKYEAVFYYLALLIIVDLVLIFCASRIARRVVDEERQELQKTKRADNDDGCPDKSVETTTTKVIRRSTRIQRRVIVKS